MRPGGGLLPAHCEPLGAVLPIVLGKSVLEGLSCFCGIERARALCDRPDATCRGVPLCQSLSGVCLEKCGAPSLACLHEMPLLALQWMTHDIGRQCQLAQQ